MLPLGHSSTGFLISQLKKPKPSIKEIIFVIFCSNIFDLDILYLYLTKRPLFIHHQLPSHTPFFGIFYFLILYLIFKKIISKKLFILAIFASLSHLFLDNLTYIIYPNISTNTISWLYPLYDPTKNIKLQLLNQTGINRYTSEFSTVINYYFSQKPLLLFLEIFLFILAFVIFVKKYSKHDQKI